MKKAFIISFLFISTLNILAQSPTAIKFTATIANRISDTIVIRGAHAFQQIIPVNAKQQFEAIFEAPKGFYNLSNGREATTLYLKPSTAISLTMDATKFGESILYTGKGSDESNFLAQYSRREENFTEEAFTKEKSEFEKLFEIKKKEDQANLEVGDYDPEFKKILLASFENNNRYILQAYESVSPANKLKGTPSPEFNFENHKGGTTKLSDLKGMYVYIDIWATWCAPCRQEIPYLHKIVKKYEGKKIAFVSISIDQKNDYEKWKTFVSAKQLDGTQLFADNDWNSDFMVKYGVTSIPRFIILSSDGNIVNSNAQRPSDPKLQEKLDSLLF
ncbi:MAG: thiol-disulfide isomerase/thioredoxin [Flavobacteriales bacterium]|jgi:thiol-disulfide isomerase/thioredoxin